MPSCVWRSGSALDCRQGACEADGVSAAELICDRVRALPKTTQAAVLQMLRPLAEGGTPASARPSEAVDLPRAFQDLADTWRRETALQSFMQQRAMHPAYQRIIGMGWLAVPLILRELERRPDHWLWALEAITGEQAAPADGNFQSAVAAWLEWGRERGLLHDAAE